MKRRRFLVMLIPAVATACVGFGSGMSAPSPTEGVEPEESEAAARRSTSFDGGDKHREFMKRARDRREAAKDRRERRQRLARARRRRRNN
jgi:hypothetical protein